MPENNKPDGDIEANDQFVQGEFVRPEMVRRRYFKGNTRYSFFASRVDVLKVGDYPQAWVKSSVDPYFRGHPLPLEMDGEFRYDAPFDHLATHLEYEKFRHIIEFYHRNIPDDIRRELKMFNKWQWDICALAMRTGDLDLIRTNRALAMIAALNNIFLPRVIKPWRRARSLIFKKRRDIAGLAGFPASSSSVKMLGKLDRDAVSPPGIRLLRDILCKGDRYSVDFLRHVPEISFPMLNILSEEELRRMVDFRITEELSAMRTDRYPNPKYYIQHLRDIGRMAEMLQIKLPQIKSCVEIDQYHDELVGDIQEADFALGDINPRLKHISSEPFSEPPLPDIHCESFDVEYIRNPAMLYFWGHKQRNCVFSYLRSIQERKIYIYRIIQPEEATVSISRVHDGWDIEQLAGVCNRKVADITEEIVKNWLKDPVKLQREQARRNNNIAIPRKGSKKITLMNESDLFGFRKLLNGQGKAGLAAFDEHLCRDKFYQTTYPENAVFALQAVNGQLEPVFVRYANGAPDPRQETYDYIEEWLWENTESGRWRQMKLPFPQECRSIVSVDEDKEPIPLQEVG